VKSASVMVPGAKGRFRCLKITLHHLYLINGKVKVKTASGTQNFDVKGGVIEVLKNKVIVLAESV
jgi:F-type H+-transporting ATPase subunit epsilon